MKLLSERLEERATFEDARVLDEAKHQGFVPEVYTGSQTGALLREAAAELRAVREAPVASVGTQAGIGDGVIRCDYRLIGQRVRLVPEQEGGESGR
jgi:hypothetical protein